MPSDLYVLERPDDHLEDVASALQHLPEGRLRWHPEARGALICWVLTIRERYDRQARLTLRGLKGKARERRRGLRKWGRMMCRALDALILTFNETIDMGAYDAHCQGWDAVNPPGTLRTR